MNLFRGTIFLPVSFQQLLHCRSFSDADERKLRRCLLVVSWNSCNSRLTQLLGALSVSILRKSITERNGTDRIPVGLLTVRYRFT